MQEEKSKQVHRSAKADKTSGEAYRLSLRRFAFLGRELLWCGIAALLGQAVLLFDTRPLGAALLCSSMGHLPAVLAGLLLSLLWQESGQVVYLCTYLAIGLFCFLIKGLNLPDGRVTLPGRLLARLNAGRGEAPTEEQKAGLRAFFDERLCLSVCVAAVSSLIPSVTRIIAGGFRYYDLFAALFLLLLTPAAVIVYSVAFEGLTGQKIVVGFSEGLFLLSLMYAAVGVRWAFFALAPALGLFLVLWISARRSPLEGALAAILCGLAESPLYIPAYLPAVLLRLLLPARRRGEGSVLIASLSAAFWRTYVGGFSEMTGALIASLAGGAAFTLALRIGERMHGEEKEERETAVEDVHTVLRLERDRSRAKDERFRGISEAFSSLSEVFYDLSDRLRRPGKMDLRRLCDDSFERFCSGCANRNVCWGLEYSETLGTLGSLVADLHKKGSAALESIPASMRERCGCSEEIIADINRECSRLTGRLLRNNRTEIFAMDYEAAADIIREALEEDGAEYRTDPELEGRVAEYLKDAGVASTGVTVYGKRRRQILVRGADPDRAKVSSDTLHADLEELCGSKLTFPVLEVERGNSTLVLKARQRISVRAAENNVSSDGGVSGDSINLFSNRRDCFYALISDGMGAGREAALTSGICSVFLEKMLRAGNRASTSLRMLNNLLRSRGEDSTHECSSTVDLLELDLMSGEASFIKSGAAPGFVVRGQVVRRFRSGTLPIGILCAPDAAESRMSLLPGDTVVMISDGVLQSDPDCKWLVEYLEGAGEETPEEIVYRICLHAADCDSHDDCSAVAIRIEKAE